MQRRTMSKFAGDKLNMGYDFSPELATGATVTGTPTVASVGDETLIATFASTASNVVYYSVEGGDRTVNNALVRITAATSDGEVLVGEVITRTF